MSSYCLEKIYILCSEIIAILALNMSWSAVQPMRVVLLKKEESFQSSGKVIEKDLSDGS